MSLQGKQIPRRVLRNPKFEKNNEILGKIIDAPNVGMTVFKAERDKQKQIIDFTFTFVNRRTQEYFGTVNPIGTRLTDYSSSGIGHMEYLKEVIETGKKNSYIRKIKSGSIEGWFLFSNAFLKDDSVIQIWEDITELKETEQELLSLKDRATQRVTNKYLVLFNSIDQGVAHCKITRDKNGNIQNIIVDEVNSAWERIMGVKPENVIGKSILKWLPNLDSSWIKFCQRVLDTGNPDRYEARVGDLGGRWFDVFVLPLEDDYFMALCSDVSARRKEQEELEKAIGLRDEFISLASHELKTPVTSLKVYAQYLERKFYEDGDKKTARLFTKMVGQVNKLTLLISDLLDVTKIENGKLAFREELFSFDKLLSEIIEQVQRTSTSHTIIKKGTTRKKLYADRERVGQVLINLLTNAIKYSPQATRVELSVKTPKTEIIVKVKDFGVGIAKDKQKRIFERFYREEAQNEKTYPGLGIGLYIASEIIKRYNGKIWVTSRKGKGATFCFSIPLTK